jgi:predicted transcriptional regulator
MPKKRKEIEIAGDILLIAQSRVRKTRILHLANLNSSVLERYLTLLRRKALLEFDPDSRLYIVTKKGKVYLEKFEDYKKYKQLHVSTLLTLNSLLRGKEVSSTKKK